MIQTEKINIVYQQAGDICVLASYGIIMDYFSNKSVSIDAVYNCFVNQFPELSEYVKKRKAHHFRKDIENQIANKYHDYCMNNGDIRGFNYIARLHNSNLFKTRSFCVIIGNDAVKEGFISISERQKLRENLKLKGGLAMVLFPAPVGWHTIVVGFASNQGYFLRDPNDNQITNSDFLAHHEISEYIWFSKL